MGAIVVLGVFMADLTFRAARQPRMGETLPGLGFAMGPGGKGSNQAVGAAKAGGEARIITRLGRDAFAEMARATWAAAGVTPDVTEDAESHTGAASIFIEAATGDNAIIIAPGAAGRISVSDIEARAPLIAGASIFMTQLEQPLDAALRALQIARAGGARTILNPAPAAPLPEGTLALCDYLTPNESEAELLTGLPVTTLNEARTAAAALRGAGAGTVILTLGEKGALYHDGSESTLVPAFDAGPVAETTGAGDAFNGAFAAALARGMAPRDAVRFGCAAAAISVTRPGAAASMPTLTEIEEILARG